MEHHCEVCGVVSVAHYDPEPYLPPRCCHGCPCGETQPELDADGWPLHRAAGSAPESGAEA